MDPNSTPVVQTAGALVASSREWQGQATVSFDTSTRRSRRSSYYIPCHSSDEDFCETAFNVSELWYLELSEIPLRDLTELREIHSQFLKVASAYRNATERLNHYPSSLSNRQINRLEETLIYSVEDLQSLWQMVLRITNATGIAALAANHNQSTNGAALDFIAKITAQRCDFKAQLANDARQPELQRRDAAFESDVLRELASKLRDALAMTPANSDLNESVAGVVIHIIGPVDHEKVLKIANGVLQICKISP